MKHLRYLLMAALVALPLTACDEDDDKEITPPVTPVGTVSGTVSAEGNGLAGVSVTLVGATSQSATTGSGGSFSFSGVEAGSYGVSISDVPSDVSFSTTAKTTSITTDGQTVTVDFSGSYIRTSTIAGQVVVDGAGIAGVAVTATGPEGDKSAVTDNGGNYSFSGLRAGDYTVALSNIPADYTFSTSSYAVSLGTGEAKTASFFGDMVVTVDPVTAAVVIKSVTTGATNVPVVPSAVAGQIDVTLQVDPGENELSKVSLLLNGEVVASQTLSQAVAAENLVEKADGIFEIVFSINTGEFDGNTGVPTYLNGDYVLSAVLGLENAQQSSVSTSVDLTFRNVDTFIGTATPGAQAIGTNGLLYYGGSVVVDVLPVAYSGNTVSSVTVRFSNGGAPVALTDSDGAPYSVTFTSTGPLAGYQTPAAWLGAETFTITSGLFDNGTVFPAAGLPANVEGGNTVTIDNVAPPAVAFSLPQQVSGATHPVRSANNWINGDLAFSDMLAAFTDNVNGVGGVMDTYHIGAATLTQAQIAALDAVETPAEAEANGDIAVSMVNTVYEPVAVITDALGNATRISMTGNADNRGGDLILATADDAFVGYDKAVPTNQAAVDPDGAGAAVIWQDNLILNSNSPLTPAVDGFIVQGTEDRAGFSATPLRMWLSRLTAAGTTYPVAAHAVNGGLVNEAPSLLACAGAVPANGAPCLPDKDAAAPANTDAYYTFYGYLVDQGGNEVATPIEYDWLLDVTAPTTQNVALPPQVVAGAPVTFSAPVSDNLDLWEVAFGMDFGDLVYIPFGENVMVGDGDRWDGNLVTSGTAVLTLPNAVVARERADAAAAGIFAAAGGVNAPAGAFALATNVRAITEDAAGNLSAPLANNFIAGTVDPNSDAASFTAGAGTTATGAWDVTAPSAADNLCNGQGTSACAAADETSITITATALGVSGVYPNPFGAGGQVFYYVHLNGVDGTYYTTDDQFFLVGSVDAANATFTDDGTVRTYNFSFTLTSDMVASIPDGTVINLVAIGFNAATGTTLVSEPNALITVVNGS